MGDLCGQRAVFLHFAVLQNRRPGFVGYDPLVHEKNRVAMLAQNDVKGEQRHLRSAENAVDLRPSRVSEVSWAHGRAWNLFFGCDFDKKRM